MPVIEYLEPNSQIFQNLFGSCAREVFLAADQSPHPCGCGPATRFSEGLQLTFTLMVLFAS